jgi:hypothetical protein
MDDVFPIILLGVAETHCFLPIMKISQIEKWAGIVQSPPCKAKPKSKRTIQISAFDGFHHLPFCYAILLYEL